MQYMWLDTWADSQGESLSWLHPHGSLNHLFRGISSSFPLTNHFDLVHSPYLVYLRILPCGCTHLLAKMDPTKKASE